MSCRTFSLARFVKAMIELRSEKKNYGHDIIPVHLIDDPFPSFFFSPLSSHSDDFLCEFNKRLLFFNVSFFDLDRRQRMRLRLSLWLRSMLARIPLFFGGKAVVDEGVDRFTIVHDPQLSALSPAAHPTAVMLEISVRECSVIDLRRRRTLATQTCTGFATTRRRLKLAPPDERRANLSRPSYSTRGHQMV